MEPTRPFTLFYWCRTHSSRTAVVSPSGGRRTTYAELAGRACRAASVLRDVHGVGPGDRAAVIARNGLPLLDVMFGCMALGAASVPINHRLARPEVDWIIANSRPKAVLTAAEFSALANASSLESFSAAAQNAAPAKSGIFDPESTAVVFYTSGTTGRPKGAMLSWRMLEANARNTAEGWGLGSEDVAPVATPLFHSGGLNIFLLPILSCGGTAVLSDAFEPGQFMDIVESSGCTVVFAVPTMYTQMAHHPSFPARRFERVRFFVSGGAPCPPATAEAFRARSFVFKEGFGLTECGVNCFQISDDMSFSKPGSVGVPIANTRARLEGGNGSKSPDDVAGELCLAGEHVFSGYLDDPEATAQTLHEGWVRTGDLARRDAEGHYYIVGRKKDMYISGGENVYPAEVEAVLAAHPAVAEAAVAGAPDPVWGESGAAFVVLRPGMEEDADGLKAFCAERLARYKVPKRFIFVQILPRTAYGKVPKAELFRLSATK